MDLEEAARPQSQPAPAGEHVPQASVTRKLSKEAYGGIDGKEYVPYITSTTRQGGNAVVMIAGVVLAVLFAASTAYSGMKSGLTVAGGIPGAILGSAIIAAFARQKGILGKNLLQGTSSGGETVASGLIFVLPAVFLIGGQITFFEGVAVGTAGVLFGIGASTLVHNYLLVEEHGNLIYPESMAISETLVASEGVGASLKYMGIGFGIAIDSDDDPLVQVAADASYALGHGGAPAGTPVDFFPFLRWLPRWFHDRSLRFARDWRWAIRGLHDRPFEAVLALAARDRRRSLIKEMLDQREAQLARGETPELTHDDIKGAAGAVFAAGQDTTWATLLVFVLNMVLHPEVQDKARRLLDEVVGRDRLPAFSDRPRLTYIDYIVQEALRWCPVSPIGVPHRSLADDVYNGYWIPAGSFVYANARAMTHDPDTYADPDAFNPDRFAPPAGGDGDGSGGGLGEPFPSGQFGFGRRVCIGKHLAEASVWIVVASVLSTMRIEKARDEHGNEIEPEVELTQGLTSHPKPFPCRIVPRDERAAELVRRAET